MEFSITKDKKPIHTKKARKCWWRDYELEQKEFSVLSGPKSKGI